MDMPIERTNPNFWNIRYAKGTTPWDFGGVPTTLNLFIWRMPPSSTVLIPGCGSGYEVKAFHEAGHEVLGIDFSIGAIERVKTTLDSLAQKVLLGDFFTYDFKHCKFDFIYERTFLCSLPPVLWNHYVKRMKELLSPCGSLIGIFLYGNETEPPPYPLTEKQAVELFSKDFQLLRNDPVLDSLPIFKGMERWQEWQKIT